MLTLSLPLTNFKLFQMVSRLFALYLTHCRHLTLFIIPVFYLVVAYTCLGHFSCKNSVIRVWLSIRGPFIYLA